MTDCTYEFDVRSKNIFEAARDSIRSQLAFLAEVRSMVVTRDELDTLADSTADSIDLTTIYRAAHSDMKALVVTADRASDCLDFDLLKRCEALLAAMPSSISLMQPAPYTQLALVHHLSPIPTGNPYKWRALTPEAIAEFSVTPAGPLQMHWNDGVVTNSYHLGLALHRLSNEGPAVVGTAPDGVITDEEYWEHGQPHRDSRVGPAVVRRDRDGLPSLTAFIERGKVHRNPTEGPARISRCKLVPQNRVEEYLVGGVWHRDDGPATVAYDDHTGRTAYVMYYRHGKLHRDDGPASINYDKNTGRIIHCAYAQNDLYHREGGPASSSFDTEGRPVAEYWYKNGILHRDDGPAVVERGYPDGDVILEVHWQDGVQTAVTIDKYGVADAG